MAAKLFAELQKNRTIICGSPKLRKRLYQILAEEKLGYTKSVIAYTNGKKDLGKIGFDAGRLAKWIESKRLLKDEVEKVYNQYHHLKFQDIEPAWTPGLSREAIRDILEPVCSKDINDGTSPFRFVNLHKAVVRISLI